jgi:hypothetical protein
VFIEGLDLKVPPVPESILEFQLEAVVPVPLVGILHSY